MEQQTSKYFLTWDNLSLACKRLAQHIKTVEQPDVIIALARGGLIPGCLISHSLEKNVHVLSFGVESYSRDDIQQQAEVYQKLDRSSIEGKKVLIVDDLVDTGDTMMLAKEEVFRHGAVNIKTAVLFYKACSVVRPDFYATTITKDIRVVFPWE